MLEKDETNKSARNTAENVNKLLIESSQMQQTIQFFCMCFKTTVYLKL